MEESWVMMPRLIGRAADLARLNDALSDAIGGKGRTILVSGEAGIGKTRLVTEVISEAAKAGTVPIKGWCLPECLEPLMPIKEALRSAGLQNLMTDAAPPRLLSLYLLNDAGILFAKAERTKTEMDADIFAAMLKAVSSFVTDSLRMMGREGTGGLSAIGHSGYKILIQSRGRFSLAAVIEGLENEFLIEDINRLLTELEPGLNPDAIDTSGNDLADSKLAGLLGSAKYDGTLVLDDPRIKQENLFDNVLLGLQRMSQASPVLLFLDDIQWADPSTLGLLHYLSRNTRDDRILLLATYRPEDVVRTTGGAAHHLETVMQNMSRESLFHEIRLKRLGQADTGDIVSSALGAANLPEVLVSRIYSESEGNPFFILEILRLLAEEGIMARSGGEWVLAASLEDIHLPSKIYDVIQRRLNRLLKDQYDILECASVVGEKFGSDVVGQSLGVNRIMLLKNLNEIEKVHRLIHALDAKYCFDHSKIREVLYNGISPELRVEYHRMVGDSYSELFKGREEEIAEELAYHYMEADDPRAARHLMAAGHKAKMRYSNEEAIRFFNLALERSAEDPGPSPHDSLGDLYSIVGQCDKSVESYARAIDLPQSESERAEIYRKMALAHERQSEYEKGIQAAEKGLELMGESPHPLKSTLLAAITWNQIRQSNYDEAMRHQELSLENARLADDSKALSTTHHLMGTICWLRGSYEEALGHYQEALTIQRATGDERGKSNTLNNIAVIYMETGKLDEALAYFEEGLAYEEMVGDKRGMAGTIDNIGNLYHTKGEVEKSLGFHLRSLDIYKMVGDKDGIAWALSSLGYVYPDMGDVRRGIKNHEESVALCEEVGDQHMLIYNYYGLAECHARLEEFGPAQEYIDKAMALSIELGARREQGASTYVQAIILRGQTKFEEAHDHFATARTILSEVGDTSLLAMIDYDEGLALNMQGHKNGAEELLNKALGVFQAMGMGLWVKKAKTALAGSQ